MPHSVTDYPSEPGAGGDTCEIIAAPVDEAPPARNSKHKLLG